jgi:hypothetical protein
VSIKGSPQAWFAGALRRGDLVGALSEASELPAMSLADALALTILMVTERHRLGDRAVAKWLARFALKRPAVTRRDLQLAAAAFDALSTHPEHALELLAGLSRDHRITGVVGLNEPQRRQS